MSNVIEIKNITKDYGQGRGVFHASFEVAQGEVMGFLGPNGAGKTTTIRQVMGFIKPDRGSISINGFDSFKDAACIQKSLGYLPGEIALPEDLSAVDFVKFYASMRKQDSLSRAHELFDMFELSKNDKGKIKRMSKGMKQKIGIICAFMGCPDVYVLDEPTSGLDPLMQNRFVDLIHEENRRGATVLMSSHMFEEVERTAARTAIIKSGHIVAVEDMHKLREGRAKSFTVTFANTAEIERFAQAHPQITPRGLTIKFAVNSTDKLIKSLALYSIADIETEAQTLEEFFMHFYGDDTHA